MDRHLPDEELHNLLHQLAEIQENMNNLLTKIYTHIELDLMHQNTIKKMLEDKGTTLTDILQVTAMFVLLILPFLVAKLWWWVWFWGIVLGIFAGFEIVSFIATKRTLSQQFGKFKREHPVAGWCILGSMLAGWLVLLWHLM